MSTRHRPTVLPLIAVLMATVIPLCLTDSPVAAETQQAETESAGEAATWKIQILGASRPATVRLERRSRYGGTEPASDTPAPEGKRWVVVRASATAPSVGATLKPDEIRITDNSGNTHAGLALTHIPADGTAPSFLYFEDSEGLGFISAEGEINWLTAYGKVSFQTVQSLKIALLFALPSSATAVSLEVGNSGKMALPKAK